MVTTLSCMPKGAPAWLTYDQYQILKSLYATLENPLTETGPLSLNYVSTHHFLSSVAKLDVPETTASIHFNAFALLRRGYKQEELTEAEYCKLHSLMERAEKPDIDDMDLHAEGTHRAIYNYLVRDLSLSVAKGRGPVWHRVKLLMVAHKKRQVNLMSQAIPLPPSPPSPPYASSQSAASNSAAPARSGHSASRRSRARR